MAFELVVGAIAGFGALAALVAGQVHRRRKRILDLVAGFSDDSPSDGTWLADGTSDLAGYTVQHVRPIAPLLVLGWPVRCGERRYENLRKRQNGSTEVLDTTYFGFVALHAADLPEGSTVRWRLPPSSDTRPAAKFVRALWADLSVHLDDRVELRLSEAPETVPEAVGQAALRLVAGARALELDEQALVSWLADARLDEQASPGLLAPRDTRAWRAEQLLIWFEDHPLALEVARREREVNDATLRTHAALVLSEAGALLALSAHPAVPVGLQRRALARGLEVAVAEGDFAAVREALADRDRVLRWPELIVAPILASTAAEADAIVFQLLAVLPSHPQIGPQLLIRVLLWSPPDWKAAEPTLMTVLLRGDARMRTRLLDWLDRRLGQTESARLCLATLARNAGDTLDGEPWFEDEGTACALVMAAGARGGAEVLKALRPWAQAVTPEGRPATLLRDTVAAVVRGITERLPAGLVGGLSMVEAEAGALSVAAPPKPETR